jgi:type I restriction-modification system DNA methylase subunit
MADPNLSSFIWSVADLLRGDYKQSEYGKVIVPFTVLRRLDCVLEKTNPAVRAELEKRQKAKLNPEPFLLRKADQLSYNTSPLEMKRLMGDPTCERSRHNDRDQLVDGNHYAQCGWRSARFNSGGYDLSCIGGINGRKETG